MTDQGFRLFYRIAHSNPTMLDDFLSNAARGRPTPPEPEDARLWDGLSVYSTAAQARRQRRRSPMLGTYIAVLRVPLDGSVRIERTRGEGHHTIWGDAALLWSLVVAVEPI